MVMAPSSSSSASVSLFGRHGVLAQEMARGAAFHGETAQQEQSSQGSGFEHVRCAPPAGGMGRSGSLTSVSSAGSQSPHAENIKVLVRVRPPVARELGKGEIIHCGRSEDDDRGVQDVLRIYNKQQDYVELRFDCVLDQSTSQSDLYDQVSPAIDALFQGYNATVFAYGQTGTGKTYSILGPDLMSVAEGKSGRAKTFQREKSTEHDGIIPKTVDALFERMNSNRNSTFRVMCSYMEIYNERINDLSKPPSSSGVQPPKLTTQPSSLEIREDARKGVFVPGLTEVEVSTPAELYQFMYMGAKNRSVSVTAMNDRSSRSHTILQITLIQERPKDGDETSMSKKISKLNLVDLAGSEKWRAQNKMDQQQVKEMTSINISLSALGNCISALLQSGRKHVPFRDSKLTRLLQDSFGGNTKTFLLATISPSVLAYEETCSTLKFADRAKKVVAYASINEVLDETAAVRRLEKEVVKLRGMMSQGNKEHDVTALEKENEEMKRLLLEYQETLEKSTKPGDTDQKCQVLRDELEVLKVHNALLHSKLVEYQENSNATNEQREEIQRLNRDGVPIAERLAVMEYSVLAQTEELKRIKTLFAEERQQLQDEIANRDRQLEGAQEREEQLREMVDELRGEVSAASRRSPQQRGGSGQHKGKECPEWHKGFRRIRKQLRDNCRKSMLAFKKNMAHSITGMITEGGASTQSERLVHQDADIGQVVGQHCEALLRTLEDDHTILQGQITTLFYAIFQMSLSSVLPVLEKASSSGDGSVQVQDESGAMGDKARRSTSKDPESPTRRTNANSKQRIHIPVRSQPLLEVDACDPVQTQARVHAILDSLRNSVFETIEGLQKLGEDDEPEEQAVTATATVAGSTAQSPSPPLPSETPDVHCDNPSRQMMPKGPSAAKGAFSPSRSTVFPSALSSASPDVLTVLKKEKERMEAAFASNLEEVHTSANSEFFRESSSSVEPQSSLTRVNYIVRRSPSPHATPPPSHDPHPRREGSSRKSVSFSADSSHPTPPPPPLAPARQTNAATSAAPRLNPYVQIGAPLTLVRMLRPEKGK